MEKFSKKYTKADFISANRSLVTLCEFFAELMESLGHHKFVVLQWNDFAYGDEHDAVRLTAEWTDEEES